MKRWLARSLLALAACSGRRAAEPPLAEAPEALAGARWMATRGDGTAAAWAPSFADAITVAQPLQIRVTTAAGTTAVRGWAAATRSAIVVATPGEDLATTVVRSWPDDRQVTVTAPASGAHVRGVWCTTGGEQCTVVWWSPAASGVTWHIAQAAWPLGSIGATWQLDVADAGLFVPDLYQTVISDPRAPVLYVLEARGRRWSVRAIDVLQQRDRWRTELPVGEPPLAAPPLGAASLEITGDGTAVVVVAGAATHGAVGAARLITLSATDGIVRREQALALGSTAVASSAPVAGPRIALLGVNRYVDGGGEGAFRNLGELAAVHDVTDGAASIRRLPPDREAPSAIVGQGNTFMVVPAGRPWHAYPATPPDWSSAGPYDLPATGDRLPEDLTSVRAVAARSAAAP